MTSKTGKIWKIYNTKNVEEYAIHPTFILRDRDVIRLWKSKNDGAVDWLDTAEKELVLENVQADTLRELRLKANEIENSMRKTVSGGTADDIPEEIRELIFKYCNTESTAKTYISAIRSFMKKQNDGKFEWKPLLLDDVALVRSYVVGSSPAQQRMIANALLKGYKAYTTWKIGELEKIGRTATHNQELDNITQMVNDTGSDEDKNRKTIEEMIKIRDALKDKKNGDYIIACLYTMIPPKRPSTLIQIGFNKKNKAMNYLDIDTGILHLTHYKTVGSTGAKKQKLPDELMEVIRQTKKGNEEAGRTSEWLFPIKQRGGRETHCSVDMFKRVIHDVFQTNNNAIRHQYITDALDRGCDMEDVCEKMDTSVVSAMKKYDDKRRLVKPQIDGVK